MSKNTILLKKELYQHCHFPTSILYRRRQRRFKFPYDITVKIPDDSCSKGAGWGLSRSQAVGVSTIRPIQVNLSMERDIYLRRVT